TRDTRCFWRLRFEDGPPLAIDPDSGGLGIGFDDLMSWGIVLLVVALVIALFSRRVPLAQLPPVQAGFVRVLGLALLLVGLFLPGLLTEHAERPYERRLAGAAQMLAAQMPQKAQRT